MATCSQQMQINHSVKLQELEDGQESLVKGQTKLEKGQKTATASRAGLHKRVDVNVARMDKWWYIAFGAGSVLSIAVATVGFFLAVFWWAVGNNVVLSALTAVKDAG